MRRWWLILFPASSLENPTCFFFLYFFFPLFFIFYFFAGIHIFLSIQGGLNPKCRWYRWQNDISSEWREWENGCRHVLLAGWRHDRDWMDEPMPGTRSVGDLSGPHLVD
jgi:hypothetical protein